MLSMARCYTCSCEALTGVLDCLAHALAMSSPKFRLGRVSQPNTIHSITTVSAGRVPLFTMPENVGGLSRRLVIASVQISVTALPGCDAGSLHWLMQLQSGSLGACLQLLKSRSGRYNGHAIRRDEWLRGEASYLPHSPVRAGLCKRPQDYPAGLSVCVVLMGLAALAVVPSHAWHVAMRVTPLPGMARHDGEALWLAVALAQVACQYPDDQYIHRQQQP